MGYEPTDVQVRSAPKHFIYFFGFAFACTLAAWAFMSVVDRTSTTLKTQTDMQRRVMPPVGTPLLQSNVTARLDMQQLRQVEYEKSHTTAIVDQAKGVAMIPVKDAMEIVIQRGLPTRPNARIPEDYVK